MSRNVFDIVRRAGLSPSDLSRYLGVSRGTCSQWVNGHKEPHHLHRVAVMSVLDAIRAAVRLKALPVALPREADRRAQVIQTIIDKHIGQ